MDDAQNPQRALDIAAAATRQAQEAASLPRWAPMLAGVLTGLFLVLMDATLWLNLGVALRSIAGIATIVTGIALYKVVSWMRATRRARGVLPLTPPQWQSNAVWGVFLLAPAGMLIDVIVGAWTWYAESGRHTASRKMRPRQS
ncbi:hypothetical protein ACIP5Y_37245 [Nocardia sp. NPDC088792]|uniref:hypothetical protein n=1 Tax=Nocardia sp. NPDC088792 TaxID=3364332 RepID=UPI00381DCB2B